MLPQVHTLVHLAVAAGKWCLTWGSSGTGEFGDTCRLEGPDTGVVEVCNSVRMSECSPAFESHTVAAAPLLPSSDGRQRMQSEKQRNQHWQEGSKHGCALTPVEDIELAVRHRIEVEPQQGERHEVPGRVDQQASVAPAGAVAPPRWSRPHHQRPARC